jgi:hypothetical protein
MTYNSILGKFMVMITDTDISRRVFSFNDTSTLLMAVHPSAKNILGPNNLAFMHGPAHKVTLSVPHHRAAGILHKHMLSIEHLALHCCMVTHGCLVCCRPSGSPS